MVVRVCVWKCVFLVYDVLMGFIECVLVLKGMASYKIELGEFPFKLIQQGTKYSVYARIMRFDKKLLF